MDNRCNNLPHHFEETKPWVLIPAYEPTAAILEVVKELHESHFFQNIIVVDDGSSQATKPYLQELEQFPDVNLLTHAVNRGKGQALKTGLNYFLLNSTPETPGLVTADADGQHLSKDIIAVAKAGLEANCFTLGTRDFSSNIPLRSQFGNIFTKLIFRFFTGVKIQDTQTGLRYIPIRQVSKHIQILNDRYEYEFSVLVSEAVELNENIVQIPISTVYINGNISSNFHVIRDSISIYSVFLKFISLSFLTSCLDYIVFSICYFLTAETLLSFIMARISAVIFNFCFSRQWVFKARCELAIQILKYLSLVTIFMLITYNFTIWFSNTFNCNVLIGKFISEGSLFILSYFIQRNYIFSKINFKNN
ncbi:MAG: bifunctional glycosyltransferase family 2/GtrA family protein [Deltaproteobacteria bacterium]|jgi:glycosyltransferase involved in cell wall biosynthesis|nr:bifunctional glycosyltransferase family 2/GtrA family protein [Deltaproteobacteria bacterium]